MGRDAMIYGASRGLTSAFVQGVIGWPTTVMVVACIVASVLEFAISGKLDGGAT